MNAERLLQHYEKIADAPDAIARLRRFILDLAVRGKLVPQDPTDEPASELLKRIAKEKARLVRDGKFKTFEGSPDRNSSAFAFEVPCNWTWCFLDDIAAVARGGSPRPIEAFITTEANGIPWIKIGDSQRGSVYIDETKERIKPEGLSKSRLVIPGDLLLSNSMSFGFPYITNVEGCIHDGWLVIRTPPGLLEKLYLHKVLLSDHAKAEFSEAAAGAVVQNLNADKARQLSVPLPPLAEQRRVVAKVDELMGLCDRLAAARAGREAVRDRLAAASLARLNAPDPESFQSDARFVLDALPALTTRPDQIKRLRQTILNLAVRGKLVPQDPNDEPAADLLKRIANEKARLVNAGGIARDKPLPPLTEADTNFELPRGWEWVRLGHLSKMVTSGSRDWAKHYANEGAIFVRMGNLSKDHYRLRLDHIQHVKPPTDGEGTRTRLAAGDILISITGEVGMLGLIPDGFGEAYINQHTAMVRPIEEIKGRYLPELFRSPFAQAQFNEPQRGIKNSFRLTDITQFVVPLPPLDEQHRIVAKVDALMTLCDRLEASLAATAATRRRLLDALLAEALESRSVEARSIGDFQKVAEQ